MNTFVTATNAYARDTNDKELSRDIDIAPLTRFMGLILFLGMYRVPDRRSIWIRRSPFYNNFVATCMTRHRFESILRNLHWVNTA
jgi:hypothetical protein